MYIDCFKKGEFLSHAQAMQFVSMYVEDPTEQCYYNPTCALNIWERCVNNMGNCLTKMGGDVPHMGLMMMMTQLQILQFMMYRQSLTIDSPRDCFYYGSMLQRTSDVAIKEVACKQIVAHNVELFDILITLVEKRAQIDPGANNIVVLLKNKIQADTASNVEERCDDAFIHNLAERMLVPDFLQGEARLI